MQLHFGAYVKNKSMFTVCFTGEPGLLGESLFDPSTHPDLHHMQTFLTVSTKSPDVDYTLTHYTREASPEMMQRGSVIV